MFYLESRGIAVVELFKFKRGQGANCEYQGTLYICKNCYQPGPLKCSFLVQKGFLNKFI